MANFGIWNILGLITVVLLIVFFFRPRRNAVWGGLFLGIIIGLIIAILFVFRVSGFDWYKIVKCAILGTIIGFIAELLGKVSDFIKKRK
ncbi:MAG: hypothetical protein ISS45_03325 [Candidatus Omnitrophica bacterium]|nr:hypothetical protein [Candidatus Omnitrophota bacterium]